MILVTFRGAPCPLQYKVKGITWCAQVPGPSPAAALADALRRFPIEKDGLLFVAPGAIVSTAPVWEQLKSRNFDVAACVDRVGSVPATPQQFTGIGIVHTETILVRPTLGARRLVDRWIQRNEAYPGRDAVNLCVALTETKEVAFAFLGPDWRWRPGSSTPEAYAVVRYDVHQSLPDVQRTATVPQMQVRPEVLQAVKIKGTPKVKAPVWTPRSPEVLQSGHFLSWASYGRLNREILFRISNSLAVRIESDHKEAVLVDEYTRARVESFRSTLVSRRSPILRVFGPDHEPQKGRFSINLTLMETEVVHQDMVEKINSRYAELWTPTEWGRNAFISSGVRIPTRVIPLGVDTAIYKPQRRRKLPPCRLVSTSKRGSVGTPTGFVVLVVGLPSRRKNFELIAEAIESVFPRRADIDLVIATTHAPLGWADGIRLKLSKCRTRVWLLDGQFTDYEMASLYASCDAVASASLGEGWFLPGHEGAACGKPIVVPANSVHPEVFGPDAWMFGHEGMARIPEAESVSPWYAGARWPVYGEKSKRQLGELLLEVYKGGRAVRERTAKLRDRMTKLTWDITASAVARRLIEVQP